MSYNVICQRCGFQYKDDQLSKEAITGYMVCKPCLDPPHPQLLVRGVRDQKPLPYVSPEDLSVSVEKDINSNTQTTIPTGTFTTNNSTYDDV